VTPLSQSVDQPEFLSVTVCSQRAPLKLTNTVSAWTGETLTCVTPLSQTLDQPEFWLLPVCSQRAPCQVPFQKSPVPVGGRRTPAVRREIDRQQGVRMLQAV
jgi:hypothetical protein